MKSSDKILESLNLKDVVKIDGYNFTVSTVELQYTYPKYGWGRYETCIFKEDIDSNVIRRYDGKEEAINGHNEIVEIIKNKLGLTPQFIF